MLKTIIRLLSVYVLFAACPSWASEPSCRELLQPMRMESNRPDISIASIDGERSKLEKSLNRTRYFRGWATESQRVMRMNGNKPILEFLYQVLNCPMSHSREFFRANDIYRIDMTNDSGKTASIVTINGPLLVDAGRLMLVVPRKDYFFQDSMGDINVKTSLEDFFQYVFSNKSTHMNR